MTPLVPSLVCFHLDAHIIMYLPLSFALCRWSRQKCCCVPQGVGADSVHSQRPYQESVGSHLPSGGCESLFMCPCMACVWLVPPLLCGRTWPSRLLLTVQCECGMWIPAFAHGSSRQVGHPTFSLPSRRTLLLFFHLSQAHDGPVTGISLHPTGDYLLSSSTDEVHCDCLVSVWSFC